MVGPGSKVPHVKSANFISEMVDQFNVAGISSLDGNGNRVVLIIGRNQIDIKEETFVEISPGAMQPQVEASAITVHKLIFANLSMTVQSAKQLIVALQQGIDQADATSADRG